MEWGGGGEQDKRVWHSFRSLHFTYHRQYNHTNTWIHQSKYTLERHCLNPQERLANEAHHQQFVCRLSSHQPPPFFLPPPRSHTHHVCVWLMCVLSSFLFFSYPSPGIIVFIISIYVRDVYNVRIWWCYCNNTFGMIRQIRHTHSHTVCARVNEWRGINLFYHICERFCRGKLALQFNRSSLARSPLMHLMDGYSFLFLFIFSPLCVHQSSTTIDVAILMRSFKIWFVIILDEKKLLSS